MPRCQMVKLGRTALHILALLVPCILWGIYSGCQQRWQVQPLVRRESRQLLHSSFVGHTNKTTACEVVSFRMFDPPSCMDSYNQPFSGCLSPEYEADMFMAFLGGKPVHDLRCGFVDPTSQHWLAKVVDKYKHCTYVIYVISFSYGKVQTTKSVRGDQKGVCFIAFLDQEASANFSGGAGFGAGSERWQVEIVDPRVLADTVARASKLLRVLAPRLFPSARYSFYMDYKVVVPPDPLHLFHRVESSGYQFALATVGHPAGKHDVFTELIAVLGQFRVRRLNPKQMNSTRGRAIKGRDFDDVFRQYSFYRKIEYPMHHTGMLESALLLWNHQNDCGTAIACMWHNQLAYFSMRMQLSFNYVLSMLGLTQQVVFLPFVFRRTGNSYRLNESGPIFVPATWPPFGKLNRDELW